MFFEHPKHMLKLMDKTVQFYSQNFCLTGPMLINPDEKVVFPKIYHLLLL